MHFWRDTYNRSLIEVAAAARQNPDWMAFGEYCELQEQGLRKRALVSLGAFIERMEVATFIERKKFVGWLLHQANDRDASHMLKPHPLLTRIVGPTLREWEALEPECGEVHRWLGGGAHLRRAMMLDAEDGIARKLFVDNVLSFVRYSVHELPIGYLGDPHDDLADLAEARTAAKQLASAEESEIALFAIGQLRNRIEDYLAGK